MSSIERREFINIGIFSGLILAYDKACQTTEQCIYKKDHLYSSIEKQKFYFNSYILYHCYGKSWEIEPTIKFIGQLIVRRGENKILLSACRQKFSTVTFLCVLFCQTEKLLHRPTKLMIFLKYSAKISNELWQIVTKFSLIQLRVGAETCLASRHDKGW